MWNWWKKDGLIGTRSVRIGRTLIFRWAFRKHSVVQTERWPRIHFAFWWICYLSWRWWSIEIIWDLSRWAGPGYLDHRARVRHWYNLPPQNPFASRKK